MCLSVRFRHPFYLARRLLLNTLGDRQGVEVCVVRLWLVSIAVTVAIVVGDAITIVTWSIWAGVEWWFYLKGLSKIGGLRRLLHVYGRNDALSHRVLESKLRELDPLSREHKKIIDRILPLIELRSLLFGKHTSDRYGLVRTGFIFSKNVSWQATELLVEPADITDAATAVSELHWRLLDTASQPVSELTRQARHLYQEIFGEKFERKKAEMRIEKLTDAMQRHGGLPFLVLNLISKGRADLAKNMMRYLLSKGSRVDEEMRSVCYWISELSQFKAPSGNFDENIRCLYHLCFIAPDSAEFLEIDSPYFTQFETLSEMAREGFLYKETLVDGILKLWQEFELFGDCFRPLISSLLQQRNKIYDKSDILARVFEAMRPDFCREYLWVIEGNLAYAKENFTDALSAYDEALKIVPDFKVALMNRVFATARLNNLKTVDEAVKRLMEVTDDVKALYVAGDAYLLCNDKERASLYFKRLKLEGGWDARVEYYQSVFCFDHGLIHLAIEFGEKALEREPSEASVRFHLSRCYKALGENDRALEIVGRIDSPPPWINYYRFTLERDAGKVTEASQTLYQIPKSYLEEEAVLNSAVEFARFTSNLALLRHLKSG